MSLLLNNRNFLYLVDEQMNVKTTKLIETSKLCQKMAWSQKGLIVFCGDSSGQEILWYNITLTNITKNPGTYLIEEEAKIKNIDEIFVIIKK